MQRVTVKMQRQTDIGFFFLQTPDRHPSRLVGRNIRNVFECIAALERMPAMMDFHSASRQQSAVVRALRLGSLLAPG